MAPLNIDKGLDRCLDCQIVYKTSAQVKM